MNLTSYVLEAVPLFLGLIQDLVADLDCSRVRNPGFNDAVEESHKIMSMFYYLIRFVITIIGQIWVSV